MHQQRLACIVHVRVASTDNHDGLRLQLERAASDSQADIVALHVEIGDDAVELVPVLHDLQSFGAAVGRGDGVAFVFKDHLQRAGHVDFIVDDQERFFLSGHGESGPGQGRSILTLRRQDWKINRRPPWHWRAGESCMPKWNGAHPGRWV